MKIGILTLWQSSDNYGQQLQCWALQQELLKLGHTPYLIRYDIEHRFGKQRTSLWKKMLKAVLVYPVVKSLSQRKQKRKEVQVRTFNAHKNKERNFEGFRERNILMSKRVYHTLEELRESPPEADAYIVGSDQVWAHLLDKEENTAMFLNFGGKDVRRIAYAPSFSMPSYPKDLKMKLQKNLSRFDNLSVREQTGVAICGELGLVSKVVVDPTMLLQGMDYTGIKGTQTNGHYVYLYYLNISCPEEVEWTKLQSFANKNNQKIIATPASGYIQGRELFDGVDYRYATIPQWIGLIDNARLVVTTSFHGVVFCILHHTPFVYFPLKGQYSRGNNRVVDLCDMLGLSERIWNEMCSFDSLSSQMIDWDSVDAQLKAKRLESIDYLECSLA